MSTQDTSFEALAASLGDYAVDSEWMGDSPPALTTDFVQSPSAQHLHPQETQPGFSGFGGVAGIVGPGKLVGARNPLLPNDPNSQPATVSSSESLLSSFNDSSSDHSSKQTSMTAVSSVIGATRSKRSRGQLKGSRRSAAADASTHAAGSAAAPRSITAAADNAGGDISMAENWSFRDYLRLDDDPEDNSEDGHDVSMGPLETSVAGNNTLETIDPKSIQRTPNDARESQVKAASLSPYSTGLSPFDFVSASSSPRPEDTAQAFLSPRQTHMSAAGVPSTGAWHGSPVQQQQKRHSKAASQHSLNQSMDNLKTSASREASPVSNFVFSQGPSPTTFLRNTHSPADSSSFQFGYFPGSTADPMQMASGFMFPDSDLAIPTTTWPNDPLQQPDQQLQQLQQQQMLGNAAGQVPLFQTMPAVPASFVNTPRRPLRFFVGVTPHKSRVETQIPVTIFLSALPPGVTKLHLPPHTISKPKLLAKGPVERSPNMLELHTMVVCTSAMQKEESRRRALERAAAAEHGPRSAPSFDSTAEEGDDCSPADGGEIWICKGCIQRERKRANRKKSKKPEDDEQWSREEHRRIIIFNTTEIKDWQHPTPAALSSLDENSAGSPIEAVISVPMRITCYCRHHGEKAGFQVIFTLKDFRGLPIAQTVSRSIMITDDHKTPTAPSGGSASASASAAPSVTGADALSGEPSTSPSAPKSLAGPTRSAALGAHQSSSDLKTLKRGSIVFSAGAQSEGDMAPRGAMAGTDGSVAAEAASHTISSPPSPDGVRGHSSKKRKSSAGVPKLPKGLVMTRIDTSPQPQGPHPSSSTSSRNGSSASPVAHFTSASSFLSPPNGFAPDSMAAAVDMALMNGNSGDPEIDNLASVMAMGGDPKVAGPLTPNSHTDQIGNVTNSNRSGSFDNMATLLQNPMFSAPASAQPSRPPSPHGLQNSMQMFQQQFFHHQHQHQLQQQMNQAQFSQQFPTNVFSLPMSMSHAAAAAAAAAVPTPISQPVIHKIIPAEGPKSGGIEVTVLGSAFYQGLDVMFGDQRATTTTFWGESSLVCLVPPSSMAGHVHVTLRQANQRATTLPFAAPQQQRIMFKYLDDDEQQLLRAALTVLSRKMTGKIEDAQEVARRIMGSETANWGVSGNTSSDSSAGNTRGVGGHDGLLSASASLLTGAGGPRLETQLLKVLELIDLDDSSNQTRLNMQRRTTGHSMLHLACVLGMHRFVAGLLARGANPDVRDNGGYTPLHLAALNKQPEIVRRLIHAGADPTMRTLSGLTASEVTASREVLRAIKRFERHARSRSGGSLHSRTSSAASLRSLWEPMTMSTVRRRVSGMPATRAEVADDSADDSADTSSHAEVDSSSYAASSDDEDDAGGSSEQEEDNEWLDMRSGTDVAPSRGSMSMQSRRGTREASPDRRAAAATKASSMVMGIRNAGAGVSAAAAAATDIPAVLASPAAAAVTALKDQLSAHFQQLVSQIPPMPNNPLPDYYHAYLNSTAFQRISSFVPNIGGTAGSRPNSPGGPSGGGGVSSGKEFEGRWWDLTSLMASSAPPPAYDEIYPHKNSGALDTKLTTTIEAKTVYDRSRVQQQLEEDGEEMIEKAEADVEVERRPTGRIPALLQIGRKHQITKEQQENFRRAHKEKRKGLRSDTFLYTVWIPLLLGVLLLWLSGARAWNFLPSVSFNVPYATSLGNPTRQTTPTAGVTTTDAKNDLRECPREPVLPLPPAITAVPDGGGDDGGEDGGGHGLLHDILGGRVGGMVV